MLARCWRSIASKTAQDRFGKPPEPVRSASDEDEGLSFTWAPASMPGGQPLIDDAEHGASYLPLMGSLRPDTDVPSSHHLVCDEVIAPIPFLQRIQHEICATLRISSFKLQSANLCGNVPDY